MEKQKNSRNDQNGVCERTYLHRAGKQIEHGAQDQEKCKQKIEHIREPSQATYQIIITLRESQLILRVYPMRPGHERLPVFLEDLNAAKAPAETLFLQAFEVQRHQSAAKGAVDIS